jgi:hypothetical protein
VIAWAHVFEKVNAIDQLHREKPELSVGHKLIQSDEIWMGDSGERTKLLLEA